jgi:hypothetical protein
LSIRSYSPSIFPIQPGVWNIGSSHGGRASVKNGGDSVSRRAIVRARSSLRPGPCQPCAAAVAWMTSSDAL